MSRTPYDDEAPHNRSLDEDIPVSAWALVGLGLVLVYIFVLTLLHAAA